MNKRIIISESEKKRILSQHKQNIKNESELKKQSLSERELSKLVNRVLIQEQLQVPGLPEGMVECIGNLKSIDLKQQTKIAAGCKDMDVTKCSEAVMSVGVELVAKAISNPSILVTWGTETMEFTKCMSEKFEMDLPIENLASSKTLEIKEVVRSKRPTPTSTIPTSTPRPLGVKKTSEMKEALTTKCSSNSDCKPPLKCLNGKCDITTALKTVKETEEMNEVPSCPRGWMHCPLVNQCCPPGSFCAGSQGCRDRQFRKVPGGPTINESDEIIYEIEMDEEEMKEAGPSTACSKCFSMGKVCCHKGTGNPKCCDYCGENDSCGTRVKI